MAGLIVMTNEELIKRYLRRERPDFDIFTDALSGRREIRDRAARVSICDSAVAPDEFAVGLHGSRLQVYLTREELRSLVDQAEALEV